MNTVFQRLRGVLQATTPAVWVLLAMAVFSTGYVLARKHQRTEGGVIWTFSRFHAPGYEPVLKEWNRAHPADPYQVVVLDYSALENRMLSGFLSGTPVADLMEVERNIAARAFTGPLEDVGFVDLTDRLMAEGLMGTINPPSFSPWTSRGRIFGLPHDVHPVMLAYRADIVEAAGIDLTKVETWDEFFAAMRPLMTDTDGDGRPERYLLNYWPTNSISTEMLLLQAGGALFDRDEKPTLNSDINVRVVCRLATWCAGPSRIAVDAPEFSAAGNALKIKGVVLASLMPDWLAGVWKTDLPGMAGQWKLMPLPAWEPGGLRTSVQGGSMLGIPKSTHDFESAWAVAKRLYLNPEGNAAFFRRSNIIPPSKASWSEPVFDEPDPYFAGQPAGRLFINQAPSVPFRSSSPFNTLALARVTDVIIALSDRASADRVADPDALEAEARRLLDAAQAQVVRQINRNVFLGKES